MTLPKGYVPPNKKAADEKAKQLADEKAKQLADEKAKQLADEKAKQLADEKAKQLADEKAKQLADEKAKQLADEKAKQLADEKAKQLADEKAKQLADEKAKQLADEKAISKGIDNQLPNKENLYRKSGTENDIVDSNINYQNNDINYTLIWDEMNKAYVQTMKEATNSYFRLMEFWMKNFKK